MEVKDKDQQYISSQLRRICKGITYLEINFSTYSLMVLGSHPNNIQLKSSTYSEKILQSSSLRVRCLFLWVHIWFYTLHSSYKWYTVALNDWPCYVKGLDNPSTFHIEITIRQINMEEIMSICMMTLPNGNFFYVTVPLCGEFTVDWWIPHTKANDAERWCFLWYVPEQMVEQTIEMPLIWNTVMVIMMSL